MKKENIYIEFWHKNTLKFDFGIMVYQVEITDKWLITHQANGEVNYWEITEYSKIKIKEGYKNGN